jgi:hypothetical protein
MTSSLQVQCADRPKHTHPLISHSAVTALLEAFEYARDLQADVWDFAIELESLRRQGLTESMIRWLLSRGYVLQGSETTRPSAKRRSFQPVPNLALNEASCFVLTPAGAAGLRSEFGATDLSARRGLRALPRWDPSRRELSLGPQIVKQFRQPAPCQELILSAFQEEGWPARIDDPLIPQNGQDPKQRLHETINNLNRHQRLRLLHFGGDGTGHGILWQECATPPSQGYARATLDKEAHDNHRYSDAVLAGSLLPKPAEPSHCQAATYVMRRTGGAS